MAVLESQYAPGYWKRFSDSSGYQHATYEKRLVIFVTNKTSVLARLKIRGYVVTVTGSGQSAANVVKFAERLRFTS